MRQSFVTSLADTVMLAWGWRRRLIALLAGACGALAMAPLDIWPALAVSLPVGIWLIDGAGVHGRHPRLATLRSAAGAGWWFGFGYHLVGLWWLGSAFLVNGDEFAWALPLGVLVLPAGLALFFALAFAVARILWDEGPRRILTFAFAAAGAEWLRGHVLTGFPWNVPGMALGQNLVLAQAASVIGLYGLTFLTLAIFAAPASIATEPTLRGRWVPPGLALLALIGLAAFGLWRLGEGPPAMVAGVRLRIMQPNLPPDQKFIPANREEIVSNYLALSDKATSPERSSVGDVTHLFWPESAFPFILTREPAMLERIAALLHDKTILITGAIRAQEPLPGEFNARFFNSIYVIGKGGSVLGYADKVHLVPFGEYLPLQDWLDRLGLRQFVRVPGGFSPGLEHKTLAVPGLPNAAPLICYEAIFPGEVVPKGGQPVGLLINVTNDAWFGLTSGPYQHLAQARLRSIEQGLPLVRAANTGISAVIDPFGRVVASLPLGIEAVLDSDLPRAISPPLYARFGDAAFFIFLLSSVVLSGVRLRRRRSLFREPF
ncbi:Apolipoprotein N-acyltransferase [Rhizobiales bacterium GAS191]|nr:Apolipoprotein N-acyltransferase [Rhizobiales bacterium GAS191]